MSAAPEPVYVAAWGELRGENKRLPGVLRVLVGGQHAGAVQRTTGGWTAQAHGLRPTPETTHATAEEALRALLRSSWARRLGRPRGVKRLLVRPR